MKTILITGLDGSGKSTVFEKIRQKSSFSVHFIKAPQIDTQFLPQNSKILKAAQFINWLNEESDLKQMPQLKAVALLSSMLLIKEILKIYNNQSFKYVILERHPLIDTAIYGRFYAPLLKKIIISDQILSQIEKQFAEELQYIIEFIPAAYFSTRQSPLRNLFYFIYDYFYLRGELKISDLENIFQINPPSEIYYLQAQPDILYQRIKDRTRKEAHENTEILKLLAQAYQDFFEKYFQNKVIIIDTNEIENLNIFANQMIY